MKLFGALLLLAALLGPVSAHGPRREWTMPPSPPGVHGHAVPYTCGGKPYTGYVALPWRRVQGTPGVLVGHTWDGLGPMERYRTEQLAGRGYVAFALDVYGTGIRPTNDTAARAAMDRVTSNLTEYNQRLDCGFAQLTAAADFLNKSALFFNGYCFGGAMALHVARRGDPRLVGVSSFHGELGNLTSQSLDKITAAVQVHHADGDFQGAPPALALCGGLTRIALLGAQGLLSFEDEMRSQKVKTWSTIKYGNCIHGWTDPTAQAYRPFEAKQAHNAMFDFYDMLLE